MPVSLTGTIRIPAAEREVLLPLLEQHIALSQAEPGCLRFVITPDADTPGLYHLDEMFTDEDAFAFHQERTRASDWGRASANCPRDFHKVSD